MKALSLTGSGLEHVVWFCGDCYRDMKLPNMSLLPGAQSRSCDGCDNRIGAMHGGGYWVYWFSQLLPIKLTDWGMALQKNAPQKCSTSAQVKK